jgi:hypothetical protein
LPEPLRAATAVQAPQRQARVSYPKLRRPAAPHQPKVPALHENTRVFSVVRIMLCHSAAACQDVSLHVLIYFAACDYGGRNTSGHEKTYSGPGAAHRGAHRLEAQ